jgi:dienelactone hydrolase
VLYNHGGLGTVVGGDMLGTCRALAEAGYLARSEKRPETRHLTGHLDQVLAGLSQLRSHADADPNRVGLIGFSRGGLLTLQAAIEQPQSMHAVVLMAPARGKNVMEQTLQHVSSIAAPVRVFVSENDLYQTNHVEIAHDVEDALSAAGKEVVLTIYPPYEDDGHKLFFVLQEPYWNDLMAFLDQTIGRPSRGE